MNYFLRRQQINEELESYLRRVNDVEWTLTRKITSFLIPLSTFLNSSFSLFSTPRLGYPLTITILVLSVVFFCIMAKRQFFGTKNLLQIDKEARMLASQDDVPNDKIFNYEKSREYYAQFMKGTKSLQTKKSRIANIVAFVAFSLILTPSLNVVFDSQVNFGSLFTMTNTAFLLVFVVSFAYYRKVEKEIINKVEKNAPQASYYFIESVLVSGCKSIPWE